MPVQLFLGDAVLVYTKRDKNKNNNEQGIGLIRYIGYIEGCGMTEQIGIELIEPIKSGHNGMINNYQYFKCTKGHGVNVKLVHIIKKLTPEEIITKLRDVIGMFKVKLDEYVRAVKERDEYIEELKDKNIALRDKLKLKDKQQNYISTFGDKSKKLKIIDDDSELDLTTPEQDDGGLIMGQMVKKFDISRRTSFVASNPITPITPATLISTVPDTSITTPASRNVSVIYHDSESIKPKKSNNTNNNSNNSTPDKKHDNNNNSKSNKSKSNGVNNGFKNAIKNKSKNGHSKRKAKHAIKTSVSNGEFPETHKIQLLNEYSGSHSTNNGDNITETKDITYDSDNSNSQSDSVPPVLLSHSHSAQTSKQKKKAINDSHNAYFEQSKRQTKSNPNSTRSQQINNRNNINVNVNNLLNTQMYYGDVVNAPNMNDHPFIHQLTNQRKSSLPILPQQNQTMYHSNHSNHSNGFFGHNNNIKNNNNNNQTNQMPFVQDFQQFRPKTHRPIIGFDNNIIHTNMPQMSQSTRIINDIYKSQPLIHTQSQPSFNPMILGAPPNMSDEDINNIQSKPPQSRAVFRASSQNKMLKPHNNYDRNHNNNNNDNDNHWPKMFAQVPQLDQWVNASQSTRESQYSRMIRTKKILRNYEKKIKHTGRSVVTPNSTRVSNSIFDSNPYLDQSNFIKHKHNNNFNDIPEYIPTKQNNNNQYIPIHHHINNKPSKRRPVSQQFIKQQNGSSPYNDYIIKNRYIKNNNDNDNIMYYKKQQNSSKKIRKHIIEPDNDLLIKNHSRNGYINQDY